MKRSTIPKIVCLTKNHSKEKLRKAWDRFLQKSRPVTAFRFTDHAYNVQQVDPKTFSALLDATNNGFTLLNTVDFVDYDAARIWTKSIVSGEDVQQPELFESLTEFISMCREIGLQYLRELHAKMSRVRPARTKGFPSRPRFIFLMKYTSTYRVMEEHTDPTELLTQVLNIDCEECDNRVLEVADEDLNWQSVLYPKNSLITMAPHVYHRVKPIEGKRRVILAMFW